MLAGRAIVTFWRIRQKTYVSIKINNGFLPLMVVVLVPKIPSFWPSRQNFSFYANFHNPKKPPNLKPGMKDKNFIFNLLKKFMDLGDNCHV